MKNIQKIKSDSGVSPLLFTAEKLYSEGKFDCAIKEATVHLTSKDSVLVIDARRIVGLSQFQLRQYGDAQKHWEKVTETSVRPNDWFNLATSSTMNKEVEMGKNAFDKAVQFYNEGGETFSANIIMIIYYYTGALVEVGEYSRAFDELDALRIFYTATGVTDLTHLTARAGGIIPSFNEFVKMAKEILSHIDKDVAKKWFNGLKEKVDSEGKGMIDAIVVA